MTPTQRNPALDILRGVAVLSVLVCHSDRIPFTDATVAAIVRPFQTFGWSGVDLFFVLSGYLVSGLLFSEWERTGTVQLGRFFVRRSLRILPPFYFLIFSFAAYFIVVRQFDLTPFLNEVFFLQNYYTGYFPHTWSLGVEEHFYLGLLLAFALLLRFPAYKKYIPGACLVGFVVALSLRIAMMIAQPDNFDASSLPTHMRFDSLLFGVLLAYWKSTGHVPFWKKWPTFLQAVSVAAPLICIAIWRRETSAGLIPTVGYTAVYFAYGIVVYECVERGETFGSGILARSLRFVGRHSFSIYLWHFPVLVYLGHFQTTGTLKVSPSQYAFLYFLGSMVVGLAASYAVEQPTNWIRERLFPSQSNQTSSPRKRSMTWA